MQLPKILSLFIILTVLASCQSNKMLGLWQAEKVYVGDEEMTPVGRWLRLEEKGKQASGNGWRQHSVGSWTVDEGKLKIENSNGYKDDFPAFDLSMEGDMMYWEREEDGHKIKVVWKPIDQLPQTSADKLLGVWKLSSSSKSIPIGDNDYVYFAWDQRFRGLLAGQKVRGIYQVHSHRNQLNILTLDEKLERRDFKLDEAATELEIEANTVQLTFKRIDYFPPSE